MRFVKMEGLGNDFVVLEGPRRVDAADIVRWCDRRRGVGADGVLVVTPLDGGRVGMEYWNADGSPAEMCGNGLRCAARYAFDHGWTAGAGFTVETTTGERAAHIDDGTVTVQLGPVELAATVEAAGVEVHTARVGNPHAVVVVEEVASAPVTELGPRLERDAAFPEGTNVEFLQVLDPEVLKLRVWERGVGETLACGSGAAAAVAVAHHRGAAGRRATVRLPGGDLLVELREDGAWITGPAEYVFRGEWHER